MLKLLSLKNVGIGDLIAFKFVNTAKANQQKIDTFVCIAKVTSRFQEEDTQSARRFKTGEVYRIISKVQFQAETINKTNRLSQYLGIRNERSKKFECCVDYNLKSWELYLLENEKDKIEVIKNIMADVLEVAGQDEEYLAYIPYYLSSPWLDYGSGG